FLIPLCFELSRFILFILLEYGYLYWWGSRCAAIPTLQFAAAERYALRIQKKQPAPLKMQAAFNTLL
ncbi:hypothetical protein, partial [Kingella kingae]|uniref:hypothetical protein n=1 Tax=Kingella kingae TaxID=504 RepID=UPI00254F96FF